MRLGWRDRFVCANVVVLALAAVMRALDARLSAIRATLSVLPDSLYHYNMLLAWWQRGDSPRGFTLTPSPYFIDMLVELPLMVLAPDYERWSYALACAYAVLLFAALYAVVRFVLGSSATRSALIVGSTLIAFYTLAPFYFVVHAFVVNHTSEMFTTLAMIAFVWVGLRPGARRGRYAAAYVPAVALCVMSSPYFIAAYCIPVGVAATAIAGTEHMPWRRYLAFAGLTAAGTLIGLVALALVSRYAWPVRGDYYHSWRRDLAAFRLSLDTEPGAIRATIAIAIAVLASIILAIGGRRTGKCSTATVFVCAFFAACALGCVGLPLKRGAFYGPYEFRYLTFPTLLACAFYVVAGARLVGVLAAVARRRLARRSPPEWLPWTSGALGVAALGIAATRQGSSTIDETSIDAKLVRCFRDAEARGGLQDGVGQWWLARYMNAARYAADWRSPYVVVQILPDDIPQIDPRDNNLLWFDGGYRNGAARLNFLVTYNMSEPALAFFREHIGAPDRTIACPLPIYTGTGRPDFDLWVWDRDDAQRRLADLVTRNNMRSPFAPVIGADRMTIDPEWGMHATSDASRFHDGRWRWHAPRPDSRAAVVSINPMWLPSGHYRLELAVSAIASTAGPLVEISVQQERRGEIARSSVPADDPHPGVEFDVENRGGPTSGAAVTVDVLAAEATSIDLSGATLTLVDPRGSHLSASSSDD